MEWDNKQTTYLASADQWNGMKPFFEKHHIMQCNNFYSVIGGLGGLNILSQLNQPKNIIFFDVNQNALLIAQLQIELIYISKDINEYISYIYLRNFDYEKYNFNNQQEFLNLEIQTEIYNKLKSQLTTQSLHTYNYFYQPYITNSGINFNGPTMHCAKLLPFWEAEKINSPMVRPFSFHPENINTFYVGKGWLKNNESFNKLKFNILNANVTLLYQDIEKHIPTTSKNGLYSSNIWSSDEAYSGWKNIQQYYDWIIGYDDYTDVEVQYYNKKPIIYDKKFGAECNNPHKSCCDAINSVMDLHNNKFLEIIEPHPSEGMNYGFRFYNGQIRISTNSFLTNTENFDIIGIHILLGGGVDINTWKEICKKAYKLANKKLFIFEHRKECSDWDTPEWDVDHENLIPERLMDEFIYSIDYRFKKFGCANLKGDHNDPRNIMYFLNKESVE